ncbi:MAG: YcfL family protein [Methyloprofundus sp.]|nr:YcfL family protein [Methyloprofundus sp.]
MKKLMIVLSSIMLLACQATVNTVDNKKKSMQREAVDVSNVSTDSFLEGRLTIVRVDKSEQNDGLLKVQVTVINNRTGFWAQLGSWFMGDNPYQVAYRFTWLDKDGMEVETAASTWLPKTIIPGDTVRFKAISPNPRCKDFSLAIRENDNARS